MARLRERLQDMEVEQTVQVTNQIHSHNIPSIDETVLKVIGADPSEKPNRTPILSPNLEPDPAKVSRIQNSIAPSLF